VPPGEVSGGVSGAPAPALAAEIDPLVPLTIQQQRIRQSLMLRQRGYTRAQVARALEVSERTVTDWWAKAREESLSKVREGTAEVFLAELRTERDLRSNYLYQMLDRARETKDIKTQLSVIKLLETMDRTNITLAASLGTFNGFAPGAPSEHDGRNAGLSIMQDAFKEMAAIFAASPNDDDIPAVFQH
jgi:transposase-like protein